MLRQGAFRNIRTIQRNLRIKPSVPELICTSFHTAVAVHQGNEPHGPSMDDLPKAPIVNPADKYKQDGERLHEYGTYLLTSLPKFIQKFRHHLTATMADDKCMERRTYVDGCAICASGGHGISSRSYKCSI